ncbi:MAG: hypothetical protein BWY05_01219 [Euryarchaeota archaeon ADurb.Bin165]|nr:MAG: hypothetical protein BWY05_01219 [Euryarchaeota archaeon ADurb.Bin165]
MLLLAVFRPAATDFTCWLQNFPWFKVFSATLVALVTSCRFFTMRANAFQVPVRQELIAFYTICLLYDFWVDISPFYESFNKMFCPCMCRRIISHPEVIEMHLHLCEGVKEMGMVPFGYFPWGDSFLLRTDYYWSSVII